MHRERQLELADSQLARRLVDQLLKRPERTQPAAEHAPPPQQNADGGKRPENENYRVAKEQSPVKPLHQRMRESQHIDDGQLAQRIPADKHHREYQIEMA